MKSALIILTVNIILSVQAENTRTQFIIDKFRQYKKINGQKTENPGSEFFLDKLNHPRIVDKFIVDKFIVDKFSKAKNVDKLIVDKFSKSNNGDVQPAKTPETPFIVDKFRHTKNANQFDVNQYMEQIFGHLKNVDMQARIYNGESAQGGQFPYIVYLSIALDDDSGAACGGTIIDHEWVLTAAHCTHSAKSVKIYYGSTKRGEGQFEHEVNSDNIFNHENYKEENLENDVALIRTPHVDFSDTVNKVALADRDNDYATWWATASGWGATADDSDAPDDLQFADLQILTKSECWEAIGRESDNILCVSTSEGKTIGSGDSGGPLVTHDNPKLVGVSSFTLEADGPLPAGFSRVSAHRDWIRDHTGIE